MNGGGKLWYDPSAEGDLIGKTGDVVRLAVSSDFGKVVVIAASYGEEPVRVDSPYFTFRVIRGRTTLTLAMQVSDETANVTLQEVDNEDQRHSLVSFRYVTNEQVVVFTIVGRN